MTVEPTPIDDLSEKAERLITLVAGLSAALNASNQAMADSNLAMLESNRRINELAADSHHDRTLIRGLIVAFVVILFLCVAMVYNVDKNRQALNKIKQVDKTICLESNVVRAKSRGLWDEAFRLSTPPSDPAVAERQAQFKAFVADTYRERDCSTGALQQ